MRDLQHEQRLHKRLTPFSALAVLFTGDVEVRLNNFPVRAGTATETRVAQAIDADLILEEVDHPKLGWPALVIKVVPANKLRADSRLRGNRREKHLAPLGVVHERHTEFIRTAPKFRDPFLVIPSVLAHARKPSVYGRDVMRTRMGASLVECDMPT